jgi:hypothetical protein
MSAATPKTSKRARRSTLLTRCSSGGRLLTEDERLDVGLSRRRAIDVLDGHDLILLETRPKEPAEALGSGKSCRERLELVGKGLLGEQSCV